MLEYQLGEPPGTLVHMWTSCNGIPSIPPSSVAVIFGSGTHLDLVYTLCTIYRFHYQHFDMCSVKVVTEVILHDVTLEETKRRTAEDYGYT